MTSAEGVGRHLALLCLERDGRLTGTRWAGPAVRAGLLADLALAGRLTETEDAVTVDVVPSGDPLADAVARELVGPPDRSLDQVVQEGRPDLAEVARALVAEGVWEPLRPHWWRRGDRYRPADPALSRAAVSAALDEAGPGSAPSLAAAAVIAGVAGLRGGRFDDIREDLLTASGDAAWVVGAAAAAIEAARAWYGSVGRMTIADLNIPG
ncbi:GPP34 family phosphoprotein [Geodermatophilus sp. CPCC 206100]|uniref:GPP34 family phosphoprotein n=1 Tax=Geodermatophilus sp. CPCC 206100 TaxID=3020054 RepID=UPI003AFFAA8D